MNNEQLKPCKVDLRKVRFNSNQLNKLKSKLTATKSGFAVINGKLTEVQIYPRNPEIFNAAMSDDWDEVIKQLTKAKSKTLADQVRSALTAKTLQTNIMNKAHFNEPKIPAPYPIGPNGTGYLTDIRHKFSDRYGATITATGRNGQPLWSERRTFTAAQVGR